MGEDGLKQRGVNVAVATLTEPTDDRPKILHVQTALNRFDPGSSIGAPNHRHVYHSGEGDVVNVLSRAFDEIVCSQLNLAPSSAPERTGWNPRCPDNPYICRCCPKASS